MSSHTHVFRPAAGDILTCVICGLSREVPQPEARIRPHEMHGGAATPEYGIWRGMLSRCHNPMDNAWGRYGARGIIVCPKWRASFAAFLEDMGPRPSADHSIDRVNNDGEYCPENCRWATVQEQARNKRSNVWVEFRGQRMIVADVARATGIEPELLLWRMRRGMSLESAIATPKRCSGRKPRLITALGRTQTIAEWARETGVPKATISTRLRAGKTPDAALGFCAANVEGAFARSTVAALQAVPDATGPEGTNSADIHPQATRRPQ